VLVSLVLAGCASTNPDMGSDPRDPFEGFNRSMYTFNQGLDRRVLKPAATAYVDYLPAFMQTAIGNFFGNIGDVWTGVNNFLQGKPRDGTTDLMRVVFNSTFGVAGLFDVCSPALPKHDEDFGQTLGVWGFQSGPYVVLPLFGSTTLRDAVARPLDMYADPVAHIDNANVSITSRVIRLIDDRAALLDSTSILDGAALDPYQFVRDAYLQRRASRVRDGE
jgi:phospholipid-binding lipoprotein MlaA